MRTDTIELITQYKNGKTIESHSQTVFARRKSVTRSEFFASYAVGIKPTYVFEMSPAEYCLGDVTVEDRVYRPTHIKYGGTLYEIVRAYESDRFTLEVTVK